MVTYKVLREYLLNHEIPDTTNLRKKGRKGTFWERVNFASTFVHLSCDTNLGRASSSIDNLKNPNTVVSHVAIRHHPPIPQPDLFPPKNYQNVNCTPLFRD